MGEPSQKLDSINSLNESLYQLTGTDLEFYRRETGIDDEEQLKQHVLRMQKKAFEVSWNVMAKGEETYKSYISYEGIQVRVYPHL